MSSRTILTRSGAEMLLGAYPPGSCVIAEGASGMVAWWVDDALGKVISGPLPEDMSVEQFQNSWCEAHPGADAATFMEVPSGGG